MEKSPLELNLGLIQGDFLLCMVVFCTKGTLSARDIVDFILIYYSVSVY